MDEHVDGVGDRDDEATPPDLRLPNAEARPWRPSRRQVIVGGIVAVAFVVAVNGSRVWMRFTNDCDLPLWVYCINCPKLSEIPAAAERSPVGPYTEVTLKIGLTGETAYFNTAGRLVAAAEWSDTKDYCYGRWFGQRFWAGLDNAAGLGSSRQFPTPQGADTWR